MSGPARNLFVVASPADSWSCHRCGETVHLFNLAGPGHIGNLHVHHRDHDRSNNDPSNLVPMHDVCHLGHHAEVAPLIECPECGQKRKRLGKHVGSKNCTEAKRWRELTRRRW